MRRPNIKLMDGIFASILLSIFGMGVAVHSKVGDLADLVAQDKVMNVMQADYSTTWKSNGGTMTHTVNTTTRSGETEDQAVARHQAKVAALQAIYPPD